MLILNSGSEIKGYVMVGSPLAAERFLQNNPGYIECACDGVFRDDLPLACYQYNEPSQSIALRSDWEAIKAQAEAELTTPASQA